MGSSLGLAVGEKVGPLVGAVEGVLVGWYDGVVLGTDVCAKLGICDGIEVG